MNDCEPGPDRDPNHDALVAFINECPNPAVAAALWMECVARVPFNFREAEPTSVGVFADDEPAVGLRDGRTIILEDAGSALVLTPVGLDGFDGTDKTVQVEATRYVGREPVALRLYDYGELGTDEPG